MATLALAGCVALTVMLALANLSHARTKVLLASEKTAFAQYRIDQAEQFQNRLQTLSEALQRTQAEAALMGRQNAALQQAVAVRDRVAENERRQAGTRLAALEAENEKLSEWANTRIPDAMVDWMLEPVTTVSAP